MDIPPFLRDDGEHARAIAVGALGQAAFVAAYDLGRSGDEVTSGY